MNTCFLCKPGYSLNLTAAADYSCAIGTIPGCISESTYTDSTGTRNWCFGCEKGKYSVVDPHTKATSCKAIPNPVGNCLWGGTVDHGLMRGITCFRCQPGFAVGDLSGLCFPTAQKGCWTESDGQCTSCDPFAGYSINYQGNCFKTP